MMPTTPWVEAEPLGPNAKRAVVAGMLGAHLLAGWALLQVPAVRNAVGEVAPMMVEFVSLKAEAPPPPPPPQKVQPKTPPPPAPILVAAPPVPQPAPVFTAPPPPPEPPALAAPQSPPTPPAPPAPPAPPTPAAAPVPAAPKQVVLSDTDWVREPSPLYPLVAKRQGEQGTVILRVLFDVKGAAKEWRVHRGSGHASLDQAGLAAAPSSRVKPRTENGVPMEFWSLVRIDFELDR